MGPPIALTDTRITSNLARETWGQFTEVVNPQPPPANWESRYPSAFLNVSPPGVIPGGPSACGPRGYPGSAPLGGGTDLVVQYPPRHRSRRRC